MAWLAQDPYAQRQIKDFQLSTAEWRSIRKQAGNALASETNSRIGDKNATWSSKEIIGQVIPTYCKYYLPIAPLLRLICLVSSSFDPSANFPSVDQSIRIKHQGQYLWISRRMAAFARTKNRTTDHLQIRRVAESHWNHQRLHCLTVPAGHWCFIQTPLRTSWSLPIKPTSPKKTKNSSYSMQCELRRIGGGSS